MTHAAIRTEALQKVYVLPRGVRELVLRPLEPPGTVTALEDFTLQIEHGEIFGLLGPNGAGKTTLLKVLSCLVTPSSGSAHIQGFSIVGQELAVKRSIGYVTSDERSFYWRLTGRENLRFFAHLYGLERGRIEHRSRELLEKVELDLEAIDERFMNYSSGMRQKLAIARALLHDPPVLFMDEPTRSLDPQTARHLRQLVREKLVQEEGKTVLLATHNLTEAAEVCSRIGVLVRSKLRRVGSPAELRRWADGGESYLLEVEGMEAGALPEGCRLIDSAARLRFEAPGALPGGLDGVVRRIHAAGGRVLSCSRREATLEEVFERVCREAQ